MIATMTTDGHDSLLTRASLLGRLQGPDDADGWQEFYRLYGPLIRSFALKAGCTDPEADEVVQETAIAVARHLPEYRHDPAKCRFKTWLLNQTAWRVKDQLRKRHRHDAVFAPGGAAADDPARTATIERVANPDAGGLDALWDTEWRDNLLAAALAQVKPRFSPKQWQAFDLNVLKDWPAGEVAKSLGMSLPGVYLAKHRVGAALKQATAKLERLLEEQPVRRRGGSVVKRSASPPVQQDTSPGESAQSASAWPCRAGALARRVKAAAV